MQMIPVNSVDELNQVVNNYTTMGYEVRNRTPTSVKLVKDDFSLGIFLLLFFFVMILGGIIYWAIVSGRKDEVLVTMQGNGVGIQYAINPAIQTSTASYPVANNNTNANKEVVQYCSECGNPIYTKRSKFCPNCGFKLE